MDALNINALVDLLKPKDADSDSDDEKNVTNTGKLGPGDIGSKSSDTQSTTEKDKTTNDSKDIWDVEEVNEGSQYDDYDDPRPSPEYDIVYKQAVTSEDIFLQMGNKNPATASCEHVVVRVNLPDTKLADIDLDVKTKFLHLTSPCWRLALHLPHPVDSNSGNAKWDSSKSQLTVTLRLTREYDFMNM